VGHNVSEEKQRRTVMAAPLAEWRGWFLHMDCGGTACARGRHYGVSDILPHYRGVWLEAAVAALCCTICKGPALKVRLVRSPLGPGTRWWCREAPVL